MCVDSNNKVYLLEDKKISLIDINCNNISRSIETKEYLNNKQVYLENIRGCILNQNQHLLVFSSDKVVRLRDVNHKTLQTLIKIEVGDIISRIVATSSNVFMSSIEGIIYSLTLNHKNPSTLI